MTMYDGIVMAEINTKADEEWVILQMVAGVDDGVLNQYEFLVLELMVNAWKIGVEHRRHGLKPMWILR